MQYHAHVYFKPDQRQLAVDVRSQLLQSEVAVGEVFFLVDKPVGPHTEPMFQISFDQSQYICLIDWLEKHRNGLSVLVHPNIDNEIEGHTHAAMWLGETLPLKLEALPK